MPLTVPAIDPVHAIDPVPAVTPVRMADVPHADILRTEVTSPATSIPVQAERRTQADRRTHLNAAILQASVDVSLGTGNAPLALLLQTAIAGINDLLAPEFGNNAIQNSAAEDNTPEATAGRIVSISTGFYAAFRQQHAHEVEADVLHNFMTTIRGGFEQGYREARVVLQGMHVLSDAIASDIDKTYTLVQQGYADFAAAQSAAPPTAG